MLGQAIEIYRENFQASEYLDKPYVSMGVPTVVAATDEEAQYLGTSSYQRILNLIRGNSLKLKPPIDSIEGLASVSEQMAIQNFYAMAQIGSKETVKAGLNKIASQYDVDEFIFTCDIYDTEKRLENFSLLMDLKNK
jgi:alkanesulfonate monooxygenase SsuD/methylene tetrahydromethanopterin reductase-like flavin-dependent oxidoreductase (luciferase family)